MKFLNSFHLKIIAIVTMTIDHVGYHLYPTTDLYRIIGRICFPLIAFLIVEGYKHTSSFKRYVFRMFIFAVIIQVGLSFSGENLVNIFFTLLIGLIAIEAIEKGKSFLVIPLLVLPSLFMFDYGYYGILLIVLMYYAKSALIMAFVSFNIFFIEIIPLTEFSRYRMIPIQYYSLLALPLILMYNGLEGKKMKYFFYFYYPIHILIIVFIKEFLYA